MPFLLSESTNMLQISVLAFKFLRTLHCIGSQAKQNKKTNKNAGTMLEKPLYVHIATVSI